MGFQIGGRSSTPMALAEINVTPMVDVMLVLLIIFMVSAPMMQQGIQVDLPKANAQTINETPEQLILVITKDRQVLINGKTIAVNTLRAKLEAIATAKPSIEVLIQGDQETPYGFIAQAMAEVKLARIQRVGLVTVPLDTKR
jgi:biopolymer transport protein TolR